jgi:hypothetical protein
MRLRLSAVWVTMVAFESPVTVPGAMEGKSRLHTKAVTCMRTILLMTVELIMIMLINRFQAKHGSTAGSTAGSICKFCT